MSPPRLRPAVRAIVLDPAERVLLVRFEFPDAGVWATPGGGVDPGETPLDALRRELVEEVGLALPADAAPPHVWHRPVVKALIAAGWDGQTDDYYLVRSGAFEPRGVFTDEQLRAEGMSAVRWWTRSEITAAHAAGTVFAPRAFPDLLPTLLRDGPPAAPLLLGL